MPHENEDGGQLVFFEEHNGGSWTGPDDQTSAVQVVYDDENVYFGFTVTDEYHENANNSAWNGDSVQLMIASEGRDQIVALYNYALGGVEADLGEVIVQHERSPASRGDVETEAAIVRNTETKRTIYEIKLPLATLDLESLGGGVRFGLGMAINDGDEDTPGQRGWGGLGAHSIVFGKSPEETALVTLATSNDIEPGKEYYTANPVPGTVTLDGDLSEWRGIPILADPRFSVPKGSGRDGRLVLFEEHNGGSWTGPDDQTSAVQIGYDSDNLYFGFTVTDEYHENANNSAWNGDSIQLMIANADQNGIIALYNYALGGVEEELGEAIVQHERSPDTRGDVETEAAIVRDTETKRTIYEIKLPLATLGLESLELGTQFGLGMAINDGDADTPGQKGLGRPWSPLHRLRQVARTDRSCDPGSGRGQRGPDVPLGRQREHRHLQLPGQRQRGLDRRSRQRGPDHQRGGGPAIGRREAAGRHRLQLPEGGRLPSRRVHRLPHRDPGHRGERGLRHRDHRRPHLRPASTRNEGGGRGQLQAGLPVQRLAERVQPHHHHRRCGDRAQGRAEGRGRQRSGERGLSRGARPGPGRRGGVGSPPALRDPVGDKPEYRLGRGRFRQFPSRRPDAGAAGPVRNHRRHRRRDPRLRRVRGGDAHPGCQQRRRLPCGSRLPERSRQGDCRRGVQRHTGSGRHHLPGRCARGGNLSGAGGLLQRDRGSQPGALQPSGGRDPGFWSTTGRREGFPPGERERSPTRPTFPTSSSSASPWTATGR